MKLTSGWKGKSCQPKDGMTQSLALMHTLLLLESVTVARVMTRLY